MRTETQRRIETYKRYLPGMKERLSGALLMLVISIVMITSATFAWITLSSKPEVSSISTTVTANGNLEIALVHGDGTEYPTSGRGDSSAVDNDIARSNITWGNLVNLSDPVYGIQNIALRPAELNRDGLRTRPLYGAVYSADGRVSTRDTDYTFATWNGFEFEASSEKGVRAITAYKLMVSEATANAVQTAINRASQKVNNAISAVTNQYKNKALTSSNINGLKGLLTAYVSGAAQDKLNDTTGTAANTDVTDYLPQIYNLYNEFYQAMELQKNVYTEVANFQRYVASLSSGDDYVELTWEQIANSKAKYNAADPTKTSTDGIVSLPALTQFISDYTQAGKDLAELQLKYEDSRDNGTKYKYSDISTIIYRLAGTDKATVNGKTMNQIGTSDALGMLSNPEVQLTAGFLRNLEQFAIPAGTPPRMSVYMDIPIKGISGLYALVIGSGIKNAHLTTNATGSSYTETAFTKASNTSIDLVPGDKIATGNYGLAIDLWVRTNTAGTYLKLDGITKQDVALVRTMGTDGNGAQVALYSAKVRTVIHNTEDPADSTETVVDALVYNKDGKWYYDGSNEEATGIEGTPKEKYTELTTVTGYEGSNRVWDESDKPLITSDSTTQGNGSCYIFYADTPEDQAKFLKLLEAFRIAFVSNDGQLLNSAILDTENAYAVNGKVTVPLKLAEPLTEVRIIETEDEGGMITAVETTVPLKDENGDNLYAIMSLEKNTATMLTAIVYLDGTLLSNDDVLAASNIQGQLNFQFTSTEKLNPIGNSELEMQERTITATVDKTSLEYGEDELKVKVTINVEGDSPANVSAFFQRAINSMQGKRMQSQAFTRVEDGEWTAYYTFSSPGEYYLREAMLDGVNYRLSEPVHVTVSGFAPEYVGWGEPENTAVIYTAATEYPERVFISFGSDDTIVSTSSVRMVFMSDKGNAVSVKMSYNPIAMQWEGKANFGTSGVFTLQFVVVNGEYYDLAEFNESFVKVLTLSLGLYARVYTSSSQRDFFAANQTYAKDMRVELFDNAGNPLEGLRGAVLTYSRARSLTDTVNAPLTWDETRFVYTGTLSITKPGSYSFLDVTIGNNRITSAAESPTFLIRNPDPVSYNTSSVSNFHGEENVQFVPITLDAYIGPIKISNSDTAFISAVVHNSISGEDYNITQTTDMSKRGAMYYDSGSWYINLPTYRIIEDDDVGELTQEGVWTVKSISLWDVVDQGGQDHTISNKLVWTHGVDGYDFSALSTVVSCSINIEMTLTGSANLGDNSTPFMTKHNVAEESGMLITILDNEGRAVPGTKMQDLSLNLSYTDNTDRSYGYIVSGYTRRPDIKFNDHDDAGNWSVSQDLTVQYVGEYVVSNLTLTMKDGSTVVVDPGTHGVPNSISVRSQGPENNLKYTVKQPKTVFGKTEGVVTSLFLEGQDPGITVTVRVTYLDEAGIERTAQFAKLDDLAVKLQFTYKDGKTAPNGGYSWTGDNALEVIESTLTAGQNTSNGIPYTTGSYKMLAGRYGITGTVTVNGTNVPLDYNFTDIQVYSLKPVARFAGVNPGVGTVLTIFQPATSNGDYTDYVWGEGNKVEVKNFFNANFANIYIGCEEDTEKGSPDFTSPQLTINISNIGSNFENATLTIPNASSSAAGESASFTFTPSGTSSTKSIGYVQSITETLAEGGCNGEDATASYEKPYYAGRQTVNSLTVVSNGVTYTAALENAITINQSNETPPTLSFTKTTGYEVPDSQISEDGQAFTYTLPTSIGEQTKSMTEASGDSEWVQVGNTTTESVTYVKSATARKARTVTSGSGCSQTQTNYYSYDFVYALYTRETKNYTLTTITETYNVVYHLTGWVIDGVHYAPGATVTVDGSLTATPEIGVKSKTLVSSSERSGTKKSILCTYLGEKTIQGDESTKNQEASRTLYKLPSGYTWGDKNNKEGSEWTYNGELHEEETWN